MAETHWPDLTQDTVELLQAMIRNECVNDGTPESGEEIRTSDLLLTYLEGAGVEVQTFDSAPGRRSLVARLQGTDPAAPSVCLMGHTDVVPVSPDGWSRDPFGGELVDGEVWGRGAIDMLNLTSSMAVAFRHLARSGFRPRGDLIYFAVADEEAGGRWGAEWMLDHHYDAAGADYVVTEMGGWRAPGSGPPEIALTAGEKGLAWRRLHVRGTPAHGSMPYGADNALVTAAEVIRRLADYRPAAHLGELWNDMVQSSGLEPETVEALLDADTLWDGLQRIDDPGTAKRLHACAHTTFSPNVVHGGTKTNVIPDHVTIDVDIRVVPGDDADAVNAHLGRALDDLMRQVEVEAVFDDQATFTPTNTPMWQCLTDLTRRVYPEARLVPSMTTGATDARFYRARGAVAYGAGLFSPDMTFETFANRFHGHDERIDVESLRLTTEMWLGLAETFWNYV
jgi:acetylornithine deacetylase/succinyl-diaminopimelate desuccinylase-like protein